MEKTIFPMQRKTLQNETKRGGNRFKNSASLIRVQCKLNELHCSMSECWCIGRSGSIFRKKKRKERKRKKKENEKFVGKRICMKFLDDSITLQNNAYEWEYVWHSCSRIDRCIRCDRWPKTINYLTNKIIYIERRLKLETVCTCVFCYFDVLLTTVQYYSSKQMMRECKL